MKSASDLINRVFLVKVLITDKVSVLHYISLKFDTRDHYWTQVKSEDSITTAMHCKGYVESEEYLLFYQNNHLQNRKNLEALRGFPWIQRVHSSDSLSLCSLFHLKEHGALWNDFFLRILSSITSSMVRNDRNLREMLELCWSWQECGCTCAAYHDTCSMSILCN